jgi:uncharacterized protein (DUF2249 family)
MAAVSTEAECAHLPESGPRRGRPLTLTDEHTLLLAQVTARAWDLVEAAGGDRWPAAELAALAGYARAEVLRQTADEEMLLFPAAASPAAGRMARDHATLRAGTEFLERAATGEQSVSASQLAAAVRDFVLHLERHMTAEEQVLAAQDACASVPATVTLGRHPHEWYPLTEGPVVDLDALAPGEAVDATVDRLLRLRRGEQVEVESGADLSPVWQEMNDLVPGGYGFVGLQDGPDRWRMRVTRRVAEA